MDRLPPYLSPSRLVRLSAAARFRYVNELLGRAHAPSDPYLISILRTLRDADSLNDAVSTAAGVAFEAASHTDAGHEWKRARTVLREALANAADPSGGLLERHANDARYQHERTGPDGGAERRALPLVIYVPHVRSPFNLGNIIRSAGAFGITAVVVGPNAPDPDHPRCRRAAMGADACLRIVQGDLTDATRQLSTVELVPVLALETGGTPIQNVVFPRTGVLVIGHEELGIETSLLDVARRSAGIVTIPHTGCKESLNVGVATGIALSWWVITSQD